MALIPVNRPEHPCLVNHLFLTPDPSTEGILYQNTMFCEKSFKQLMIIPDVALKYYGHRGIRADLCTFVFPAAGGPEQDVKSRKSLIGLDFEAKL